MGSDGTLSASQPQDLYGRNYNDGIGQGDPNARIYIFRQVDEPETVEDGSEGDGIIRVAAVASRVVVPRPEILAAIDDTEMRYGSHWGLHPAGPKVTNGVR